MHADIIYNEAAGNNNGPTVEELEKAFEEIGITAEGHITQDVNEIEPILSGAKDLVVAAGGDGTIAAVLLRLLDLDKEIPLSILPMGTANNIATSFGLPRSPLENIAMLKERRVVPYDVGRLEAPWGTDHFIEGAGFGYFADILATYDPEKGKSIWRGVEAIADNLVKGTTHSNTLFLNGDEIYGEFLLVEVLNTTAIGPGLKFAPKAKMNDGRLNLVYIRADDREGLLKYFTSMLMEDLEQLETVRTQLIQEVAFSWNGFPVHVDGEVRPPKWQERQEADLPQPDAGEIRIKVLPGAVSLWLPVIEEE